MKYVIEGSDGFKRKLYYDGLGFSRKKKSTKEYSTMEEATWVSNQLMRYHHSKLVCGPRIV
jgi:hypothetical protein